MGRDDAGRARVKKAVTAPGGAVDAQTLQALHAGDTVSSAVLAEWAARVRTDATRVEDLHVQALRDAGLSEAAVVAVTAATAVGEADRKLAAVNALRAQRKGGRP
jgi:hypothetical protein